ncbi:uncharacterized protein LOC143043313 [Mytilus galloprovincialis]|uniref:uncharacterized protein LOC143043313 n=1 Tax=Mytilus galloprovincialis TaxID=29158 RepID=UPI003F7B926B
MRILTLCILFLGAIVTIQGDDPCTNFTTLNEWRRSVANDDTAKRICDSNLKPGWYKSISKAGPDMLTDCPVGGFRCGTNKPIWLNGTYPTKGMTKTLTACVSNYESCCEKSYEVEVKNCGGFNVYRLPTTFGCSQAYCFGTELPCKKGYTSSNGFTPGCKYEECLPVNHKTIDQWERSTKNGVSGGRICDSNLKPDWYRPISKAGNLMPTKCLNGGFKCGTSKPIWMQGSYPSDGKIVNATACASSYNGCCNISYNIQVKNCSTFYIYNLTPTFGCSQAYCFGSEIPCPNGETSETGYTPGCKIDPCNKMNYRLLNGEIKRTSNYTLQQNDIPYDDSILNEAWYRVDSASGNDIVSAPQKMNQCGTKYPVWMKGSLPLVEEKTVVRDMCTTMENGSCDRKFTIQIQNCTTYRVYFLRQLNTSFSGYCFGTLPVHDVTSKQTAETTDDIWKILVGVLGGILITVLISLVIMQIKKRTRIGNDKNIPPPPYSPPGQDMIKNKWGQMQTPANHTIVPLEQKGI